MYRALEKTYLGTRSFATRYCCLHQFCMRNLLRRKGVQDEPSPNPLYHYIVRVWAHESTGWITSLVCQDKRLSVDIRWYFESKIA